MKNIEILLNEYEQKRRKAEMKVEREIQNLYIKFPQLEEIDDKINKTSIAKTKAILNHQNIKNLENEIEELKKQREHILIEYNINENIFKPNYECKICKDTGYLLDNNNQTIMCNCLKQKLLNMSYNQSNLSDIQKNNFENFNINIYSDEIDSEKYKRKSSPKQNIEAIKKAAIKFIENFEDLEQKNLLFVRKYWSWKNLYVKLHCE